MDKGAAFTGGSGNDTFIADFDFETAAGTGSDTLGALDEIDGGGGVNTLAITRDDGAAAPGAYTMAAAKITNIQNITIKGAGAVTADVSGSNVTGLEKISVLQSVDATITASKTQNVAVSGATGNIEVRGGKNITVDNAELGNTIVVGYNTTGAGAVAAPAGTVTVTSSKQDSDIEVDGGTDVTVTATSDLDTATGSITIGDNKAASGTVTVVQNLKSDGAAAFDNSSATTNESIFVEGGKSINVTINAINEAVDGTASGDITNTSVAIDSDGKTKDVTVTQTATLTQVTDDDLVAFKAATQTVTFKGLNAGEVTDVDGLSFVATKKMSASEVAQAYANLTSGDTQSAGGPTAKGYFVGALTDPNWTSAAASGDKVTFSYAAGTTNPTGETVTGVTLATNTTDPLLAGKTYVPATIGALVDGNVESGGAESDVGVVFGDVFVNDNATASIETVTLDGFVNATIGDDGGGTGNDADALKTLNLANSTNGDVAVHTAVTTLALNVNGLVAASGGASGDIDLDATATNVETLTLTSSGKASKFGLEADAVKTLTINAGVGLDLTGGSSSSSTITALVDVDVNGAGAVNLGDITDATSLKTFNAADNEGGITATIEGDAGTAASITEYVFSAGADTVKVEVGTGNAVDVKVSLGGGNDTLELNTGINAAGAMLDGGTGTNTLKMAAANAATASAGTTFEATFTNFQKLSLAAAAAQETVKLQNMNDISYVIAAGAAVQAQTATMTVEQGTKEAGAIFTVTINGKDFTYTADGTEADDQAVAAAIRALINADTTLGVTAGAPTPVSPSVITLTASNGLPFTVSVAHTDSASGDQDLATAAGTAHKYGLTLEEMASGGTLELTASSSVLVDVTDADTNDAAVLNIITKTNSNTSAVAVNDVETINITTNDAATAGVDTQTLVLSADAAETIVVSGTGNLTLQTFADALTLVDGSANLSGSLTYTANLADMVVKGGSGADSLTANANGVKLYGNGGGDTLKVNMGVDSVRLFGGAGNDTFEIKGGSTTNSTYTVIDGVNAGDVISLFSGAAGTTAATSFKATKVELSEGATVTTQALIEKALGDLSANEIGWFTNGNFTFLVLDGAGSASTTYQANDDVVVMLTGVVDLSTASFNTSNLLEIA